ncbi:MAG: hypothetical protein AAF738_03355, partial [Bacteroidota bacterium]
MRGHVFAHHSFSLVKKVTNNLFSTTYIKSHQNQFQSKKGDIFQNVEKMWKNKKAIPQFVIVSPQFVIVSPQFVIVSPQFVIVSLVTN